MRLAGKGICDGGKRRLETKDKKHLSIKILFLCFPLYCSNVNCIFLCYFQFTIVLRVVYHDRKSRKGQVKSLLMSVTEWWGTWSKQYQHQHTTLHPLHRSITPWRIRHTNPMIENQIFLEFHFLPPKYCKGIVLALI